MTSAGGPVPAGAIALGCMRLSTAPDRDDAAAHALLLAALAAGVTVLDTADAYAHDAADVGHNERLIAGARTAHAGATAAAAAAAITVITKGGLLRHDGHWHPDGRARHLAAAAAASRDRLGGAPLDLYLLHTIDPHTPLATSVRALARLHRDRVARAIGLCNVSRTQLAAALALAPITAVQLELSPWQLDPVRGGTLALAAERDLTVLAHRPLGGPAHRARLARDPVLTALAARHTTTPAVIALAWLRTLGPRVIPLPGPTQLAHALDAVRAARLVLTDDDRRDLDQHFLGLLAPRARPPDASAETSHSPLSAESPPLQPAETASASPLRADTSASAEPPGIGAAPAPDDAPEVVLILGIPGAGKTTLAADLVARGYLRLNRDQRGGRLDQLAVALDHALATGTQRAVLDNTYPSRASRAPVIAVAHRHRIPVRCVVADTPLDAAQVNAAARLLDRHGALLAGPALTRAARTDPGAIGPGAQFAWRRAYEPPALDEGFAAIAHHPFTRAAPTGHRRAVIVELDELVWTHRPADPSDLDLRPDAAVVLTAWHTAGWLVLATAWRPPPLDTTTAAIADALRARIPALADLVTCPHPAGPPQCWCRKPLPGLGLVLARSHHLDLTTSLHLGHSPADRTFAARLGLAFRDHLSPPP